MARTEEARLSLLCEGEILTLFLMGLQRCMYFRATALPLAGVRVTILLSGALKAEGVLAPAPSRRVPRLVMT